MIQIFVKKPQGDIATLNVESYETVFSIKRKLKEQEGIRSDLHLGLMYNGKLLDDGRSLTHCNILEKSTIHLFLSQHTLVKNLRLYVNTWSEKYFTLDVKSVDTVDGVKAKIQENQGIPQHKQLLFRRDEWLEDGSRTLADYRIINGDALYLAIQFQQDPQLNATSQGNPLPRARMLERKVVTILTKRPGHAIQDTLIKTTRSSNSHPIFDKTDGEASELMPEVSSSVLTELEGLKREIVALKAETKEQCVSYEKQIVALKAENKNTEVELTIARGKVKELEGTISGLTHKNKVFSAQCASYESQLAALEVENKKTKEELMVADKKYYAGARAAGYAEGLKEGKEKWLKSVEFLHHLTDASVQYFNYGFDSCQKQAEQQGFVGQLNKDSALKDAPELKGWESSDQPH